MKVKNSMTSDTAPATASRLNLKFILIAIIALGAIGLGLVALDRTMRQRRDRQTIEWANQAMAGGHYEDAAAQYARAVARHPDDADLSLKSGDAFYALSATEPEAMPKARVAWEATVKIEPTNLPALQRILQFHLDLAEVRPNPATFDGLDQVAQKMASIAPSDPQVAAALAIAPLGAWFVEDPFSSSADGLAHDKILAALAASAHKHPSDGRSLFYYTLASLRRAIELRASGANQRSRQVLDQAEQDVLDVAGGAGETNVSLLYRAAEAMTVLSETNQRIDQIPIARGAVASSQPAATKPTTTPAALTPRHMWPTWDLVADSVNWTGSDSGDAPSVQLLASTTQPADVAAARCLAEAQSLAGRAASVAILSDPHFVDIRLLSGRLAEAAGDIPAAQQICRQTLAAVPQSVRVQLALSKLLAASDPQQAITILEQPENPDDLGPGPKALIRHELLIAAAMQKAALYLHAAEQTDNSPTRQANVQKASAACDTLIAMLVDNPESLKLTARVRILQGRFADALRAIDRASSMNNVRGHRDLDLFGYRATTLLALHQPQAAIESLDTVLEADRSRSSQRLTLVQTLIDLGRLHAAAAQLEVLEKQRSQDPALQELRVRLLAAQNALEGLGHYEREIEAFQRSVALNANDLAAIKGLAACCLSAGKVPEADGWIARGRALAPADEELAELEFARRLDEGDPRRLIDTYEAAAKKEPDRASAAVMLGRVYLRINTLETLSDPLSAGDALKKAIEILNQAVRKWPDDKSCSFWAAHASAISGDVVGGQQILQQLCSRDAWSRRPEAFQMLADYSLAWGDPTSAEAALKDGMAHGTPSPLLAQHLATLLERRWAWQDALDVLKVQAKDPVFQQQRIAIFIAAGKAAEAGGELASALQMDPTDARAMAIMGSLYCEVHDNSHAASWLDRAIAADDDELAHRERGVLRLRQRPADPQGAIADLSIACEANLSDTGAALLLGEAHVRNHDTAGAEAVLQTALETTPSDQDLRLGLISLEQSSASPNWERIAMLIEGGRMLAPSDYTWDATEARMWLGRGEAPRAAALMRHAVQVAANATLATDANFNQQRAKIVRALLKDEMRMLLAAHAHPAVLAEADKVISKYGPLDMISAWAHYARALVQARTNASDAGRAEYNSAISTSLAAVGFDGAAAIVRAINDESGTNEAVGQIDSYLASIHAGQGPVSNGSSTYDPRWDLLRIDLLRGSSKFAAAAGRIDKMMPHLAELAANSQIELLRMAVIVYLQDQPTPQVDKARGACAELLKRLPDDSWALNNMAVMCIESSSAPEPQKALALARRAYQAAGRTGPIDPQIADTYGWALARAGQPDEAVRVLEPIAGRLSTSEINCHLAEAYLYLENVKSAWPHLANAFFLIQRDRLQGHPIDQNLYREFADLTWRACRQTLLHLEW